MFSKNLKFTALLAGTALTLGIGTAVVNSPAALADYSYVTYDYDNDGYLNEDEFFTYSYSTIDYNDDDYIDEDEWDYYSDVWYEPYDEVSYNATYDFDYYDTDNDGYIETSEYTYAYDDDIFSAWDTDNDGYIESYEYRETASLYSDYDYDGFYEW